MFFGWGPYPSACLAKVLGRGHQLRLNAGHVTDRAGYLGLGHPAVQVVPGQPEGWTCAQVTQRPALPSRFIACLVDEALCLFRQLDPARLPAAERDPFLERPALPPVEVFAASTHQFVDALPRQLGDKLALHPHGEDLAVDRQDRIVGAPGLPFADGSIPGKCSDDGSEAGWMSPASELFTTGQGILASSAPSVVEVILEHLQGARDERRLVEPGDEVGFREE